MDFTISHRLPTRIRVNCGSHSFSAKQGALIETLISLQEGVIGVDARVKTGSIIIEFEKPETELTILACIKALNADYLNNEEALSKIEIIPKKQSLVSIILGQTFNYLLKKTLPRRISLIFLLINAIPRIIDGLIEFFIKQKLNTTVLDATAIGFSLLRKNMSTASTIIYLLKLGETIEEWTQDISLRDLQEALSLNVDTVWRFHNDTEEQIAFSDVAIGDVLVIRMGGIIPTDGTILKGEGLINESSITGEFEPVQAYNGKTVYAGTALEEGELYITVTQIGSSTVISSIIEQIKSSQNLKASIQTKNEQIADRLVPYNFLFAALVFLTTHNLEKTASLLVVDYSCAIKLISPLSLLSAMKQAAQLGLVVKGGKYIEISSKADTIVFDKTGTLSTAEPRLAEVIPLRGYKEREVLKIAACLEEHFPHSVSQAIVRASAERKIYHREEHTKVEYIVAHGIASTLYGERVLIGSYHFIFEDEAIALTDEDKKIIDSIQPHYSKVYLAMAGALIGILCIEDEVRLEAKDVVRALPTVGIDNVFLLTGDGPSTARAVAKQVGIKTYKYDQLPADKAAYIKNLKKEGLVVMMVGDGINDTPALSEANVGITMNQGAAIAQTISDVSLTTSDLYALVDLKQLSLITMKKIHRGNTRIIGFNSMFIFFSLLGLIPSSMSAFLHNGTTIMESLIAMKAPLQESTIKKNHSEHKE